MPKQAEEPIARLRTLLSQEPSEDNFEEIMFFFRQEKWEDDEAHQFAIEYAETHLASWPDTCRKSGAYWLWRSCPEGEPAPSFALIRYLHLGSNSEGVYRFGPEGTAKLAQSSHLSKVTELYFWGNGMQDAGAVALANSPYLSRLKDLILFGNQIGDEGAIALAESTQLPALQSLTLSYNRVGDEGAIALANSSQYKKPMNLHLNDNEVGEKGALAIVFSQQMSLSTRRYWMTQLTSETLARQAQQAGIEWYAHMKIDALLNALLQAENRD